MFLRFFNKAAMIVDNDQKPDGPNPNPRRLCSIQHIEEVKCVVKIMPIWASGIICYVAMTQQVTFTVSQALKMDRHVGHTNFQIPAGSLQVISYITIGIWLPLYDRVLLPILRKITKNDDGITTLQRIGIGSVFAVLCMVVAGLAERERRAMAVSNPRLDGIAPLSVFWLAPQLIFLGFCEVFTIVGLSEFYNKEFPHNMRSIGYSLLYLSIAGASYLSSLLVDIVHNTTGKNGRPDWLTNDINAGRLEYFYFLIAGLGALNFVYFLFCARGYKYKVTVRVETEHCNVVHEDQV